MTSSRFGHYSEVWQEIARAVPDRAAILTREDTVTWGQFAAEAGAFARFLADAGLKAGDSVAIVSYNRREYLSVLFAAMASAISPVSINFRYRAGEVRDLLVDSSAKVVVVPTSLGSVVAEAAEGLLPASAIVTLDDGADAVPGATTWQSIVAAGGELPASPPPGGDIRVYTGGTTGSPKAVVWDTESMLGGRLFSTYDMFGIPSPASFEEVVAIAIDPDRPPVVGFPLSPLMHGTALFTIMNVLVIGGTALLLDTPRFDAAEALRLAKLHRAARIIVAGDAVALPLVEEAEAQGARLPDVSTVISSGMRFSDEVKRRMHALGDFRIQDMLAASEGGPFAVGITTGADDFPARLELAPGAVIFDEEMREVQDTPGAVGILAFRGSLARGYWGDEEKTRKAFPEVNGVRHVMPGDWARVLGDGRIELLGRLGSVVNTGGEKVYPAEVEEALLAHDTIADAVVFGMPDPRFGEVVSAMVVPTTGVEVDVPALAAYLDERLAGYKKPRRVFVRETLGRSPHGKLDMAKIKADAEAEWAKENA